MYRPPHDSSSDDAKLEHVIIGDVMTEKRKGEFASEIYHVRHFQMITDCDVENFCGLETPVINGRMVIGDEEWVIENKPATDSDGFTKMRCVQFLKHEFGNTKARG